MGPHGTDGKKDITVQFDTRTKIFEENRGGAVAAQCRPLMRHDV